LEGQFAHQVSKRVGFQGGGERPPGVRGEKKEVPSEKINGLGQDSGNTLKRNIKQGPSIRRVW